MIALGVLATAVHKAHRAYQEPAPSVAGKELPKDFIYPAAAK